MESSPESTSPAASEATVRRSPLHSRRLRFLGLCLAGFLIGMIWSVKFRGTGWTQALNPLNWFQRSRGNELYLPEQALLQHGNPELPEIALTFDDGPHAGSRSDILDTLKRYGVHATFFDVGVNMEREPELLLRTLAEGHEVANHSANHQRLDGLIPLQRHREINDADISYFSLTGKHLTLLRPPGMRFNDDVLAETRALGYIVVGYTNAARDFEPDVESRLVTERTLSHLANGSILLLHDYASTAAALPAILEGIQKQGYRCVTVSEMLEHLPEPLRASARQFEENAAQ